MKKRLDLNISVNAINADVTIGEAIVGTRLYNALKFSGAEVLGDLEWFTYREFRELPNVGPLTMSELIKLIEGCALCGTDGSTHWSGACTNRNFVCA